MESNEKETYADKTKRRKKFLRLFGGRFAIVNQEHKFIRRVRRGRKTVAYTWTDDVSETIPFKTNDMANGFITMFGNLPLFGNKNGTVLQSEHVRIVKIYRDPELNESGFKADSSIFETCLNEIDGDIGGDESEIGDEIETGRKIWIDDIREAPEGYIWIKTVKGFIDYCVANGLDEIELIDTDHDAGEYQKDGGDYIRCFDYLDYCGIPDITVHIHSANPVGANNIRRIISRNSENGWKEIRNTNEGVPTDGRADEGTIPREDVERFVDDTANEIVGVLGESGNDVDVAQIKDEMYGFMSKVNTKDELRDFMREYQAKVDKYCSENPNSKTCVFLRKTWEMLKKIAKVGAFVAQNLQTILVLLATVYVCVKFHVGPIRAIQLAFQATKTIYSAAKTTLDTTTRSVEIYKDVQNRSAEIGDRVGEIIGKGIGWYDTLKGKVFGSSGKSRKYNETQVLEDTTPLDITESIHFNFNDDNIAKADIRMIAYSVHVDEDDDTRAYNPKNNPDKAIDIIFDYPQNNLKIELFLDTESGEWDSWVNGNTGKISPEQYSDFFRTAFYRRLRDKLKSTWANTDPVFARLLGAIDNKKYKIDGWDRPGVNTNRVEEDSKFGTGKADIEKSREKNAAGKQIRTRSGRKYINPSDFSVKHDDNEKYYCWPDQRGKGVYKFANWRNWKNIRPLCRMRFAMSNPDHVYGISISPLPDANENRGFRAYDLTAQPPLQYLTPEETAMIMDLTIVRKFLKNARERIERYLSEPDEEIYRKINNPSKCTLDDIRQTKKAIKNALDAIKNFRADTYIYT